MVAGTARIVVEVVVSSGGNQTTMPVPYRQRHPRTPHCCRALRRVLEERRRDLGNIYIFRDIAMRTPGNNLHGFITPQLIETPVLIYNTLVLLTW